MLGTARGLTPVGILRSWAMGLWPGVCKPGIGRASSSEAEAKINENQRVELYDGAVVVEFNERTHRYTVWDDGEKVPNVPSVTRVCEVVDKSGPLLQWAVNCALEVVEGAIQPGVEYGESFVQLVWSQARKAHIERKRAAADIGTQAHNHLEILLKERVWDGDSGVCPWTVGARDGSRPEEPRVAACVEAAVDWLNSHEVHPVHIERIVYSRKHRYVGKLDQLAIVDGQLTLVDWKSSKGIYPEHRFQTAAYVHAWEEETGEKVQSRVLVKLGKDDGKFEPHPLARAEQNKDWRGFLAALKLWRRLQEVK